MAFCCSHGLTLDCKFERLHINSKEFYCCVLNDDILVNTTTHSPSMSDVNVTGISIANTSADFWSFDFSNFSTIEGLSIENASLKEINHENLKKFPHLTHFRLTGNRIEILDKNLFVNNRNISSVFIHEEKIFHMDPKAVNKDSKELFYINLKFEGCNSSKQVGNVSKDKSNFTFIEGFLNEIENGNFCFNKTMDEVLRAREILNSNVSYLEMIGVYSNFTNSSATSVGDALQKYRDALQSCKERSSGLGVLAWALIIFFMLVVLCIAYELRKRVRREKLDGGESQMEL